MRLRISLMAAILTCGVLLGAAAALAGCGAQTLSQPPVSQSSTTNSELTTIIAPTSTTAVSTTSTSEPAASIEYRNTDYGFIFSLPESWKGYSVVTQQWEGSPNDGNAPDSDDAPVYGPEILIRHPEWTASDPRQDIPIMVFTVAQWSLVQQEKLVVGAAPIPPTELGHNAIYVFALPARYNYAFPAGYEEVAKILEGNPLQGTATAPRTSTTDPELSTAYEITEADSGRTFTYTVTSRFSVILDRNKYSLGSLKVVPSGVVGAVSNVPQVEPPLQAVRYEGVNPGTCTIRGGDFVVTVRIVSLAS